MTPLNLYSPVTIMVLCLVYDISTFKKFSNEPLKKNYTNRFKYSVAACVEGAAVCAGGAAVYAGGAAVCAGGATVCEGGAAPQGVSLKSRVLR